VGLVTAGVYIPALHEASATFADADLRGAVLRNAKLNDANLHSANLSRHKLSSAKLSGANLTGAILGHADLNHADLTGADLSNAVLESANLHSVVVGFRSAPGNLPKDFPQGWSAPPLGWKLHADNVGDLVRLQRINTPPSALSSPSQ
jgi:Pentapeptide repeats (8 copies)